MNVELAHEPDAEEYPAQLGPFEVTGVLGAGGSAIVYAAWWDAESVALKVPRSGETLTPREQERFLFEADLLARVQHEGVIEVVGSGRLPDGRPFLATKRYEGETLAVFLARRRKLPVEHALQLFEQLAEAVGALHDQGLVHRDIKPENVLLTEGGQRVKLLDLGIARDLGAPDSTTTRAGFSRGTPANMAPERFMGAAASMRSDVYELAVVLYAMLVGTVPWPDPTDPTARLIPALPAEQGVVLPMALSDAIMRALSTRAEIRPANARQLGKCILEAANTMQLDVRRDTLKLFARTAREAHAQNASDGHGNQGPTQRAPWRFPPRARIGVAATLMLATTGTLPALALHRQLAQVDAEASNLSASSGGSAPKVSSSPASPPIDPPSTLPTCVGIRAKPHPSRAAVERAVPRVKRPPPEKSNRLDEKSGALCARSSECASMVCVAEVCQ